MAEIFDLVQLRKTLNEKEKATELHEFAVQQMVIIEKLSADLDVLKKKNEQLEIMLDAAAKPTAFYLSPEEALCLEQIKILKDVSSMRAMTLDEIKRFDLLVKNLKAIRNEDTITVKSTNLEKLDERRLIEIARGED